MLVFNGDKAYEFDVVRRPEEGKRTMRYIVEVKEVWTQPVEVEASSPEEAKEKVQRGEGTVLEDRFEFSHTLDAEHWNVERV